MAVAPHALTGEAVRARLQGKRVDVAGPPSVRARGRPRHHPRPAGVLIWSQIDRGGRSSPIAGWDFITSKYSSLSTRAGIIQGIVGTVTIALFVAGIAIPVGVGAAIYLEEYAAKSRLHPLHRREHPQPGRRAVGRVRHPRSGHLRPGARRTSPAGLVTVGRASRWPILVLPIVIITSAEAIRAVPDSIREAGFGVGATRWEVIRSHVLPYAVPGHPHRHVLSLARALGEAAPLIADRREDRVLHRRRASATSPAASPPCPSQIYQFGRGLPESKWGAITAAAIVVLLVLVLMINTFAILLRNRYEKKR